VNTRTARKSAIALFQPVFGGSQVAVTQANGAGWLKQTFGAPIDVLPEENSVAKAIDFIDQEKRPGEKYKRPVRLQHEQGFAYNIDHSAFPVGTAKEAVVKFAELEGAEILGLANLSYGMSAKMGTSNSESARAYKQNAAETIEGLMIAGEIRRELALLYGSGSAAIPVADLGQVNALHGAVSVLPGDPAGRYQLTLSLTRPSYAPGMWPQLIGAAFEFSTGSTVHGGVNEITLHGVNAANGRLQFVSTLAGDFAGVAGGAVITFRGSRAKSCVGLQPIMENNALLFGIDAGLYPQWKCSQYPVGGAFTFDKLMEGLSTPHENGLEDGIRIFLGARAWNDLMTDEAALRQHVGSDVAGKARAGYSVIEFDSLCGKVTLVTHRYLKQGIALGVPTQYCERVGAQDLSFRVPGNKNEWFWRELDQNAGSQIRLYGDQAVLFTKPNHGVLYTGITSTNDVIPA
jgi:hypothetical protein